MEEHHICRHENITCPYIEEAATKAVERVFFVLGVDVNSPSELSEFRDNLRFSASIRSAANKGTIALLGIISVFILSEFWEHILTTFKSR